MSATPGTCPTGYFPIPGDSSNCTNSTQTTVVKKICPTGLVLQINGLCGTNTATISQTSAAFCGPQYATKNCVYTAQLTPGITSATSAESTNTICAFTENDTQFPCDPGCCLGQKTPKDNGGSGGEGKGESGTTFSFPWWIVLLLIILSGLFFAIVIYLVRKKKLTSSSNGNYTTTGASNR